MITLQKSRVIAPPDFTPSSLYTHPSVIITLILILIKLNKETTKSVVGIRAFASFHITIHQHNSTIHSLADKGPSYAFPSLATSCCKNHTLIFSYYIYAHPHSSSFTSTSTTLQLKFHCLHTLKVLASLLYLSYYITWLQANPKCFWFLCLWPFTL